MRVDDEMHIDAIFGDLSIGFSKVAIEFVTSSNWMIEIIFASQNLQEEYIKLFAL